jgi:hypothetical protein
VDDEMMKGNEKCGTRVEKYVIRLLLDENEGKKNEILKLSKKGRIFGYRFVKA